MCTIPPLDPSPAMAQHTRQAELLSTLYVLTVCILVWVSMAAVNNNEQQREQCRAMWVAQHQELTQEGPAL